MFSTNRPDLAVGQNYLDMKIEDHALHLGKIILNLHSLEFILRVCLDRLPTAPASGLPWGTDIYTKPVGTILPVSDLTSYESLGQLIERYNAEVEKRKIGNPVDLALVEIRDAIAHGRVSTKEEAPMHLIKFSKPRDGKVSITFNLVMDEEWFKSSSKRVRDAIFIVYETVQCLPEPKPPV